MPQDVKRAILTGASSGIGRELARELSRRGWELALLARRGDVLAELVTELGTRAVAIPVDVADRHALQAAVQHAQEQLGGPFDLAIANAGVSIASHAADFDVSHAEQTLRVNVLGMMYLFDAVIPSMIERRRGRFAGVASLVGLRGLPGTAPYSASKAAMQAFLEASRVELAPYGVGVTIINPGFVDTPMTAKIRSRPFLVQAPRAAAIIADGLERGAHTIEFPKIVALLMRTMRLVPDALFDRMMKKAARRRTK